MITVTPQGQIYLCKTPLENDYKNQLTFSNKNAQLTYFNSTIQQTFDNYTYVKKDNVVKVGINIDKIIDCNYLFYRNNGFTDEANTVRIYYCFITNMEYINENCTAITFETDCFQTWYFDINYKRCFVEREHVNNDTIGLHTIPENLELGEYISTQQCEKILYQPSDFYICMGVTELPNESVPAYSNHRTYNGIFGGLYYLVFKTSANCETAIKIYDKMGKADAINSVFMVPKNLTAIRDATTYTWTVSSVGSCEVLYLVAENDADTIGTLTGTMPTKVGKDYTPKNKKLFTYPFSYMVLTNNSGTSEIFRYEDFDYDDVMQEIAIGFWINACISPGMSMKAIPLFYKNVNYNYNYGIMSGKMPVCSWNSDVYINWLTQNGLNSALNVASGMLSAGTSIASGNVGGAMGGLTGIYNALHQFTVADMTPNQARGNTNGGDINFAENNDGGFTLYYMSVRDEMAQVIDKYFNMFGYKVNDVKIPNITGRQNWNYVKTIDCNFDGDIPQTDLNIIKSMFNNGTTLWHNPSNIYNYSLTNNIV